MHYQRSSKSVFRESDYHTPPPSSKRRRRLLERKLTAFSCTACAVFLIFIIVLAVTVGLKLTGSRDDFQFMESLGDTRLISFSPSFCEEMSLQSDSVPATMYLLNEKPPLTGWSNITFSPSFVLTEYTEYVNYYGWYDYGDFEYTEDFNYVSWNFHLNKGSEINVDACLDTPGSATFILIQGKSNYQDWMDDFDDSFTTHPIPECSEDGHDLAVKHNVADSSEFYFTFYSPAEDDITTGPRVNLTLSLHRTEYVIDSTANSRNCTTVDDNSCTLNVRLHGEKYSLIKTSEEETKDTKYGDRVPVLWTCDSRSWVYVLIFFCPLIFLSTLFVSMYCIIVWFWNRKLKSYERLQDGFETSETSSTYKIVYEPPEKKSINNLKNK